MQLVRIVHYRCDEPNAHTYILAPKDWSRDGIQKAARAAQAKYEDAVKEAKKQDEENKPKTQFSFYAPNIKVLAEKYPDKTTTEVLAIIEEEKKAYTEWQKNQQYLKYKFANFLEDEGFAPIYDYEELIEVTLDWGHQHGTTLSYEDTKLDTLPTPAKAAGSDNDDNLLFG